MENGLATILEINPLEGTVNVMQAVPLTKDLLPTLHDFIVEMWRVDGACSEMHIGDMYRTLFFEGSGDLGHSARLWFDSQSRLQAVAIFTGLTFDMVVRPEAAASSLAEDMLFWAIAEAKRRQPEAPIIRVQRRPRLPARVALYQKLGFHRMSNGAVALSRLLDALPPQRSLPRGLVCRGLVIDDLRSRLRAHVDAFPGENKLIADFERLAQCEGYDPFLDLVVVDETREVAAFCTVWFDQVNRVGLFEPVGTCAKYRQLGLASVIMSEALNRLKQVGADFAVVRARSQNTAAVACYRNLGFDLVSAIFGFEKWIGE